MKQSTGITCVFLDVGDVLLTDGWDHLARKRAAKHFKLEWAEMETRHQLTFEVFEMGRLTLEDYLNLVVFHKKRNFTQHQFRQFMFAQSKPFPGDDRFSHSTQADSWIEDCDCQHYIVEAQAVGFERFVQKNVALAVGQTLAVNVTLVQSARRLKTSQSLRLPRWSILPTPRWAEPLSRQRDHRPSPGQPQCLRRTLAHTGDHGQ